MQIHSPVNAQSCLYEHFARSRPRKSRERKAAGRQENGNDKNLTWLFLVPTRIVSFFKPFFSCEETSPITPKREGYYGGISTISPQNPLGEEETSTSQAFPRKGAAKQGGTVQPWKWTQKASQEAPHWNLPGQTPSAMFAALKGTALKDS